MNNNEYIFKVFDKMEYGSAFDCLLDVVRLDAIVRNDRNYEEIRTIAQGFLDRIEEARATCKQSLQVQPPHIVIHDPAIPWKCGCGKPGCRHCGKAEGRQG